MNEPFLHQLVVGENPNYKSYGLIENKIWNRKLDLPYGALAVIGPHSEGSLSPASFSALTLNVYSLPSTKSSTSIW